MLPSTFGVRNSWSYTSISHAPYGMQVTTLPLHLSDLSMFNTLFYLRREILPVSNMQCFRLLYFNQKVGFDSTNNCSTISKQHYKPTMKGCMKINIFHLSMGEEYMPSDLSIQNAFISTEEK